MQVDMHYYGTYAIALAAGIPDDDARILAYAAQYVDDATSDNSLVNKNDGGLLVGFTTAHHMGQCVTREGKDPIYQRKVWVPCHFIPGGNGNTMEEKSICVKNSAIARAMMQNHLEHAHSGKLFGIALVGIAAHAYMDTFAHYGFSGFSSKFNRIRNATLKVSPKSHREKTRLDGKIAQRQARAADFCLDTPDFFTGAAAVFAEKISGALGHGGVLSFPDQPYLKWQFEFELPRPGNGRVAKRNNRADYLEGCEELHSFLSDFAKRTYESPRRVDFSGIKEKVDAIIAVEGRKTQRIAAWKKSGLIPEDAHYDASEWEDQKKMFHTHADSTIGMEMPVYRFHQAAAYHRYYMLKDLLPEYGLAAH